VTAEFAEASLAAGADGLFFATQCADHNLLDEVEYREFGLQYDLAAMANVPESAIVMLHLHGESPMLQLEGKYPAHILNWHDQHAAPSLAEGHRRTGRCVAGGINERTIATDDPTRVLATAEKVIAELEGQCLVIAPGCVIPINTPPATIQSVIRSLAPDLLDGS
jgi:uroporphyrinogen decarboxylase